MLLAALAALYLSIGFFFALAGPPPGDFHLRWVENSYLARGVSSLEVWDGTMPVAPDIGPSHAGGYPPFSHAVSLLAVPPLPEGLVRVYFAALNALALLVVVRFAYRVGKPFGAVPARLLAVSTLALAANAITLRLGQYTLLLNALLILMLGALSKDQPVRSGIYLALAALKPQTSGPFALAWLRRKGPLAWLVAGALVLVFTAAVSHWLERSPLGLIALGFDQAKTWEGGDAGLLTLLLGAGLPRNLVIPGLMAVSLLAGAVLVFRYRDRSVLVRAAILAVVGRLWTYHRRYDDAMLVFLLLALGESALRRRTTTAWVTFFAVGATLWAPFREQDHRPLLVGIKVAIWIYGLVELLRHAEPEPAVRTI